MVVFVGRSGGLGEVKVSCGLLSASAATTQKKSPRTLLVHTENVVCGLCERRIILGVWRGVYFFFSGWDNNDNNNRLIVSGLNYLHHLKTSQTPINT